MPSMYSSFGSQLKSLCTAGTPNYELDGVAPLGLSRKTFLYGGSRPRLCHPRLRRGGCRPAGACCAPAGVICAFWSVLLILHTTWRIGLMRKDELLVTSYELRVTSYKCCTQSITPYLPKSIVGARGPAEDRSESVGCSDVARPKRIERRSP